MDQTYIPDRSHLIWLDFEPTKGREIGKHRPALVLSSKSYNQETGLLICCPVSTSVRGQLTEVPVPNLDKPSVIVSNLLQTLSWKERKAKHITTVENEVFDAVIVRILPLIGADRAIQNHVH